MKGIHYLSVMSSNLEKWLAQPTTNTMSTSSDVTFSFPALSSSTTDWLKQPISSTPSFTMATTSTSSDVTFSFPALSSSTADWLKQPTSSTPSLKMTTTTNSSDVTSFPGLDSSTKAWLKRPIKSTSSVSMPTCSSTNEQTIAENNPLPSTQSFSFSPSTGIQNWLKMVEQYDDEIDEDDFELVDEPNSIEDFPGEMNRKNGADVSMSILQPEHSDVSVCYDLDMWLKQGGDSCGNKNKPQNQSLREEPVAFVDDAVKGEKNIRSNQKEMPKRIDAPSETEKWILSSDKNVDKTTVTECHLFKQLKIESDNLMDWIKQETTSPQNTQFYNPLSVWLNVQGDSIDWLKQCSPTPYSNLSSTSKEDVKGWISPREVENTRDSSKYQVSVFDATNSFSPFSESFVSTWLKKDDNCETPKSGENEPLINWSQVLSTYKENSFENWLTPSKRVTPLTSESGSPSESERDSKWLYGNAEYPVESSRWLSSEPNAVKENSDSANWLHKENDESSKQHKDSSYSQQQWLFQGH